ncbi:MaoC family dehydratase [Acinetobacter sp. C_4_1]|uniref:MaoC family dehydratase n=1 Tax=unclassified Acinetobacter TaxID=196816 RepID=UPI0021B76DF0|nr:MULTISPECIES: MaoC family dehydratase [unclassified Acinetobacter]MCT8089472.1 MaoC family dehydratase [Acinetobacter sp. F_3_1]MCT8098160.1 MaoC family dehydratase [Acinetobacter sp. C_3_1]MCT8101076.1 MaoC family dehydratase [Acinetobacter sp. C_4_1]MCT8134827.1 MaoC family dehydratase [Acinetobacter sp. T_3_1]
MQILDINSIRIGDKAELKRAFSLDDVEKFSLISGDVNPIHMDAEYASKTMFGDRIVNGALACSMFSTIFANILPSPDCIYVKTQYTFFKPIYLNQSVDYVVEIINVNYEKRRVKFEIGALVDDKKCIAGTAELYISNE